jgi:outer membrane protein assembly factor BamB
MMRCGRGIGARIVPGVLIAGVCLGATCARARADAAATAKEVLAAAGTRGGLIVHVGCGDGRLTAALRANDSYLVHGLAAAEAQVAEARETVRKLGLYGAVSIDRLPGKRLPYIDNLVNLVVAEDLGEVPMSEVLRILCAGGAACVRRDGRWVRTVKPRPAEIDEWTHYMHDASGNAVSTDTVVGPPRRLQWVGSPRWSRHHEHMSSVSALVSAGGRIFYVLDEGSRASIQLPAKWKLIARDAFNGTVLWKRDVPLWYTHLYPLKSGPAFLARRLVAVGDRVYATLGLGEPLRALDAATGKTIRTYEGSKATEEVIHSDGVLFLLVNAQPLKPDRYTWKDPVCWNEGNRVAKERPWDRKKRTILAVDPETGRKLWSRQHTAAPLTICADRRHVVFHDAEKVVCLDRRTGKQKWASEPVGMRLPLPTYYAPTLVLHEDVVLFAGGGRGHQMMGLDAETGRKLWAAKHHRAGHRSPEDLLVIDGLAWTGRMAGRPADNMWTGYDVRTGEVKREFKPDIKSYWFHHRCHRSKATTKYLMPSRTGIEYVDWRSEKWDRNHWVRGACVYGVMPANGLTYAPQHPCACYIETKLNGFNALAAAVAKPLAKPPETERLTKGPAYGQIPNPQSAIRNPQLNDWPTYRHDPARSGCAKTDVPAKLDSAWQTALGGRLSSVVVAGGTCFVAAIDTHTVHALDAANGKEKWRFTAGGRVDSPPTIHNGCAIFGSADGCVYCVRASDGELVWRYLAAPADRRHVAFEQVESVWPVHGSVLVRNGPSTGSGQGQLYCVAGRSVFLDGGMRLCRIDAATGKLISETLLDDRIPGTDRNLQFAMQGLNMPPGLPDVLSCDGKLLYMRSQKFDFAGKRTELFAGNPSWNEEVAQKSASAQIGEGVHLFSTIGFLDGSWFHRSYWIYGRMVHNGCNFWFRAARYAPSGRIMVVDDDTIYAYGRLPHYYLWTPALEYRLYAADRQVKPESIQRALDGGQKLRKAAGGRWIFNRHLTEKMTAKELSAADVKWSQAKPRLIARAMVLAGPSTGSGQAKTLFVAGPPDVLDEEAAVARRWDRDVQKQLAEQDAALLGKRGAMLWAVSPADGSRLAEVKLDAPPVWDGMAAANGRLYLATTDGKVRCFAGR